MMPINHHKWKPSANSSESLQAGELGEQAFRSGVRGLRGDDSTSLVCQIVAVDFLQLGPLGEQSTHLSIPGLVYRYLHVPILDKTTPTEGHLTTSILSWAVQQVISRGVASQGSTRALIKSHHTV